MKVARVVGKLSLQKEHPSLLGRRWIVAVSQSLATLAGEPGPDVEEVIAVDDLGVVAGNFVGISDGREACAPYEPERKPVDAYTSCLLDEWSVDPDEVRRLLKG